MFDVTASAPAAPTADEVSVSPVPAPSNATLNAQAGLADGTHHIGQGVRSAPGVDGVCRRRAGRRADDDVLGCPAAHLDGHGTGERIGAGCHRAECSAVRGGAGVAGVRVAQWRGRGGHDRRGDAERAARPRSLRGERKRRFAVAGRYTGLTPMSAELMAPAMAASVLESLPEPV